MINLSGLPGRAPTSDGRHTVPMDDLRIPPGPGCPRGLRVPAAELIERFSHDEHQRERALAHLGERLTGTVLTVAAAEHRSQRRNRAAARERLAALLRASLVPPRARRATKPTRGSRRRRLAAKRRRSEIKAQRRRPNID